MDSFTINCNFRDLPESLLDGKIACPDGEVKVSTLMMYQVSGLYKNIYNDVTNVKDEVMTIDRSIKDINLFLNCVTGKDKIPSKDVEAFCNLYVTASMFLANEFLEWIMCKHPPQHIKVLHTLFLHNRDHFLRGFNDSVYYPRKFVSWKITLIRDLTKEELLYVLKDDDLSYYEDDIITEVIEWLKLNPDTPKDEIICYLRHTPFVKFKYASLKKKEQESKRISMNLEPDPYRRNCLRYGTWMKYGDWYCRNSGYDWVTILKLLEPSESDKVQGVIEKADVCVCWEHHSTEKDYDHTCYIKTIVSKEELNLKENTVWLMYFAHTDYRRLKINDAFIIEYASPVSADSCMKHYCKDCNYKIAKYPEGDEDDE